MVPRVRFSLRLAVLLACGLLLLLLLPLPVAHRATGAALDILHAPAFAVLAYVSYRAGGARLRLQRAGTMLLIWLLVFSFGALTELAQQWVGRGTSIPDVVANALGAAAGLLVAGAQDRSDRRESWKAGAKRAVMLASAAALVLLGQMRGLVVLADCLMQWQALPRVASFETELEMIRWSAGGASIRRVQAHATDGNWALRAELFDQKYPGFQMDWPPWNWSRYGALSFDATLADGPPLDLVVKIHDLEHWDHDRAHDDRFHRTVRLQPGTQRVRIDLENVRTAPRGRSMNMREVCFLQFFAARLESRRVLYIDYLRLE